MMSVGEVNWTGNAQPIPPFGFGRYRTGQLGARLEAQCVRDEGAIRLLESWLDEASGYDEQMWSVLKEAIEEDRLSLRKRFTD
jgi:hypothetical protein